jgi:hypothetical protein
MRMNAPRSDIQSAVFSTRGLQLRFVIALATAWQRDDDIVIGLGPVARIKTMRHIATGRHIAAGRII